MSVAAAAPAFGVPATDSSRARRPDRTGFVDSDGVQVFYEVYGSEEPTILLLPTWTLAHARAWKGQIPWLARHARVVTFDPRGNGRSGRPTGDGAYDERAFAGDALAVLDAVEAPRAIVVSLSRGAQRALVVCAEHPERVSGAVFIAPLFPVSWRASSLRWRLMLHPAARALFDGPLPAPPSSWLRFSARHWRADYRGFVEWFIGEKVFTEPHSTKQVEDAVGWALEAGPDALIRSALGAPAAGGRRELFSLAGRVRCPVLVVHGERDAVTHPADGRAPAHACGGRFVAVPEAGHNPQARKPVATNLALRDFVLGPPTRDATAHRPDGAPRALFACSPIGLGHARRDVAVARALRARVPGLRVEWLAQHPVTRMLAAEGETIHCASAHLASESAHIEAESAEHDLHAFQAYRRMDEILAANFMVFDEVARERRHDLWVGDEAWELDYFLHEHPRLKRAPYAWLTDFVGWLPMPDGGGHEARLAADYNAEMVSHVAAHPDVRDRALFVGEPEDIVGDGLGPDLPRIRDWTERHFEFPGYITGFDPAELAALPRARERVDRLRMVVVAGPRIDPATLPPADGLEVHAYVHDLYRLLAACDLAVVQGGLTTAMELTANRRPFLYVPLRHHFEQCRHVRHRLERYGASTSTWRRPRCSPRRSPTRSAARSPIARSRPTGPTALRRGWPTCSNGPSGQEVPRCPPPR